MRISIAETDTSIPTMVIINIIFTVNILLLYLNIVACQVLLIESFKYFLHGHCERP
jgi:hypothetical protein